MTLNILYASIGWLKMARKPLVSLTNGHFRKITLGHDMCLRCPLKKWKSPTTVVLPLLRSLFQGSLCNLPTYPYPRQTSIVKKLIWHLAPLEVRVAVLWWVINASGAIKDMYTFETKISFFQASIGLCFPYFIDYAMSWWFQFFYILHFTYQ